MTVQDVATLPPGWNGQYFSNQNLQGTPVFTRNDGDTINFDWDTGSPSGVVPADHFSARWTRTFTFSDGVYQFVNDQRRRLARLRRRTARLNAWQDQSLITTAANKQMTAGQHTVVVEYYENGGDAAMEFDYQFRPDLGGFVTDTVAVRPGLCRRRSPSRPTAGSSSR